MKIYNSCETGKAASCERCGQQKYNVAQVIDHGRHIADRHVAERRRMIDIEDFVLWQVRANMEPYIGPGTVIVQQAIERFTDWDGLRICSDCEDGLYDAVKQMLLINT